MAIDDTLLEAEEKMAKSEEVVQHEFTTIRTGKASPALIENITVEAYGSQMRLREMANITTPDSRSLLIQPWDTETVPMIEKGIQKANLGLNPSSQGKVIRIHLPDLSEERRQELVKVVRKMTEDGRVAIRHVRRDALEHLKKEGKAGGVTEDQIEAAEKEVQKITDQYIKNLDGHLKDKETEIMTV